jgi:hypothetical protein
MWGVGRMMMGGWVKGWVLWFWLINMIALSCINL